MIILQTKQRTLVLYSNKIRRLKNVSIEEEDVSLHALHCIKCGHSWLPRTTALPKTCPRCKNFNWMGGNSTWKPENDTRPKVKNSSSNTRNPYASKIKSSKTRKNTYNKKSGTDIRKTFQEK